MRKTLLATATLLLISGVANAQERGGFDPARMIAQLMEQDGNGDGKLSKEEVPERMAARFEEMDADGDGFIVKEELTKAFAGRMRGAGARAGQGRGGVRGGPGGRGAPPEGGLGGPPPGGPGGRGGMTRMLSMMPVIKALDKNGDNELSTEEIENAVAALKTLDKNKDGKISTEEMTPEPGGMMGGGRGPGGPGGDRPGRGGGERPRRPPTDDGGGN
jgi:collagen type III alpha